MYLFTINEMKVMSVFKNDEDLYNFFVRVMNATFKIQRLYLMRGFYKLKQDYLTTVMNS